MIRLFDNPKFQVAMLLLFAGEAFDESRHGDTLWTSVMIVCACFWMFRVWESLRAQDAGREQS